MVRLVLRLVLCLLAALPQGVCTCAAASCPAPTPPASTTAEHPHASGACHHDCLPATPTHNEGRGDGVRAESPAAPAHGHPDHDPDCRAVNSTPTGVRAESVTAEWPPAETGLVVLAVRGGSSPVGPIARAHLTPPPPKLPIFLALGVLRN
jgi:hypothetical protein